MSLLTPDPTASQMSHKLLIIGPILAQIMRCREKGGACAGLCITIVFGSECEAGPGYNDPALAERLSTCVRTI